jgi:glycosyltransferase involved in cell wall biosynthesis
MPPVPVLHIITRLIVGGAQINTLYTARYLNKNNFSVQIMSGSQTGPEGCLIDEIRKNNIILTIDHNLVREINPIKDLLSFYNIYNFLKKNKIYIVHTHSSKAGFLGRIAAHFAKTPIVIHTVHGWSFHHHMSPIKRKLYIALEKLAANFSDAIIVVTKLDIKKGLNAGIGTKRKYHLIRSAIPVDQFNPKSLSRESIRSELGIPTDVVVIGNIGRLSPQKNPLVWLQIAERIHIARPDVYFLMVGDGPMRRQVEDLWRRSNLKEKLILTGLHKDTPKMFKAIDIFLLTSLWEGLPRVIPESYLMNVPVVAFEVDGIQEAILHKETGFLCSQGNLNQITDYCIFLIDHKNIRVQMGNRGREFALKYFNLHHMIKQIEQIYEKFLKEKSASHH